MKMTVELDASNRMVLEMAAKTSGDIVKRGKIKVWTGAVPATHIEEAV